MTQSVDVLVAQVRAGLGWSDKSRVNAEAEEALAVLVGYAKRAERFRNGLEAAVAGLELAAGVHEAVNMDSDEDEAVKAQAVATMRLALGHAREVLGG